MSTFNLVVLQGYVGQKPKIKKGDNYKLAIFPIATHHFFKKGGDKIEETNWHTIVASGNNANFIESYIDTGDLVLIEGKLVNNGFTNPEGKKVTINQVRVNKIQISAKSGKEKTPVINENVKNEITLTENSNELLVVEESEQLN